MTGSEAGVDRDAAGGNNRGIGVLDGRGERFLGLPTACWSSSCPQMVIDFAKDMSNLVQHSLNRRNSKEVLKRFIQCVWVELRKWQPSCTAYRCPAMGLTQEQPYTNWLSTGSQFAPWPTARAGPVPCPYTAQIGTRGQIRRAHLTLRGRDPAGNARFWAI